MVELLIALGIFGVLFTLFIGIPYLIIEGAPEWLKPKKTKKKQRRELLEYIEWKRADDIKRHNVLYPTEARWNERELANTVRHYDKYDRERMLADKGNTEIMQWVLQNDPSALKARINKLEKELGFKHD